MATLVKDAPLALWRQLKTVVRDQALTDLAPGDRLPTEQELCEEYGVSRVTVRQALSSLVKDGILARQAGRGTYVLPPKTAEPLDPLQPAQYPANESCRVILYSAETVPANRRLAGKQVAQLGELVHKIRRLRLLREEPISYITSYLPVRLFPTLTPAETESVQFHRQLEERTGLIPQRGDEMIECIEADRFRSQLLRVPVGAPLLVVESVSYLASGEVMEFSRAYHRADRSRLVRPVMAEQLHSRGW